MTFRLSFFLVIERFLSCFAVIVPFLIDLPLIRPEAAVAVPPTAMKRASIAIRVAGWILLDSVLDRAHCFLSDLRGLGVA